MRSAALRHHAALRCAIEKADAQKVRLEDILQGIWRLAEQRRHRRDANRSPVELVEHQLQELAVGRVEAGVIDLEAVKGRRSAIEGDLTPSRNLDLVAHAAQQTIGDPWCAAAACRDQCRSIVCNGDRKSTR